MRLSKAQWEFLKRAASDGGAFTGHQSTIIVLRRHRLIEVRGDHWRANASGREALEAHEAAKKIAKST